MFFMFNISWNSWRQEYSKLWVLNVAVHTHYVTTVPKSLQLDETKVSKFLHTDLAVDSLLENSHKLW